MSKKQRCIKCGRRRKTKKGLCVVCRPQIIRARVIEIRPKETRMHFGHILLDEN